MKADIPPGTARRPVPGAKPRVTRRRVLAGAVGLFGLSAGTAVYAAAIEPDGLVVTRYKPALPGWPTDRKLSITVIADLHAGGPDMQLEHIRRIVDRASALQSDIVLLLGDFIASYRFAYHQGVRPGLGGGAGAAFGAARHLGGARQSRLVARFAWRARMRSPA